ncbi:MAG: tRNA (guanosine(46)-N7)-methyltransferase TrmB [Planctomycetaceae bacterium]
MSLDMASTQPIQDLKPYFRVIDDLTGPIDWPTYFGNDSPVHLDIGCGRGMFLVKHAEEHPEINTLGIEIDYREGRHGAQRLQRRRLENARVLGGDARFALSKLIPPESVHEAFVLFPDPWWKRRHRRRRLFTDVFVEQVRHALKPDGLLHAWSDVKDYFDVMAALMNHHPRFVALEPPPEKPPANDLDYHTSFERKRRQAGETIYRGLWQKTA